MTTQKSKNDAAWEALFTEHNILNDINMNGIHRITATTINKKREARLMTKFDHAINLPHIFAENNLAILPDSRSSYVIGRFECYAKVSQVSDDTIIERAFPDSIQSLPSTDLYSEATALLCAQHAGLIADVLGEEALFTVFGRMSSGTFDFSILASNGGKLIKQPISVDRAQCEIDGGFENPAVFAILEVKNEEVKDFHIRQLYYPYRLWSNKLLHKPVIPIFLTYSNEIFTFSIYEFEQLNDYNSLHLVKRKRYQIVPTDIEIADIRRILAQTKLQLEPLSVPFPQADRFERVIDLLTRLHATGGTLTQEEITTTYSFDTRQTQYYTNAGRYLGLIERTEEEERGVLYNLSPLGMKLMKKAPKMRNLALIELILSHSVFRSVLESYFTKSSPPSRNEVLSIIRNAGLSINDTTGNRRAQSVLEWVKWIIKLTTGV